MSLGKRYLVDDNGVVLSEIGEEEWVQVKTQKGFHAWQTGTVVKFRFLKMFPQAVREVGKKHPFFFDIVDNITYLDNALVWGNGTPLNTKNLAKATGRHIRTVQNDMKKMCDDDILRKMKLYGRVVYVVNPWICMKGNKVNNLVYEEFMSSKWREMSEIEGKEENDETV